MIIEKHGMSLVSFTPDGEYEYEWLTLSVDESTWSGRTLFVETRYAADLWAAVINAGFVVECA